MIGTGKRVGKTAISGYCARLLSRSGFVINGARPSSKAESLEETLTRIPAGSVVRVEIGPGDLFGGVVQGFTFLTSIISIYAGAQLFAIGIIGEYLGRMFQRTSGSVFELRRLKRHSPKSADRPSVNGSATI